jgi:2,4-dichlorophenol 6-monooxygenase
MGVGGSMNIIFKADLSKYVAHRPSVLYWVVQPGADVGGIGMGLVRMVRPWNEWLIVWGYDINEPAPDVDNEFATKVVRDLVGDQTGAGDHLGLDLDGQQHVRHAHAVGPGVHHGRRSAPASAIERAWLQHLDPGQLQPRLEAGRGAQGSGGRRLLDSYSQERAPVAKQIVTRANQSIGEFGPIFEALGLTESTDPEVMQANMDKRCDTNDRRGRAQRAAIREAIAFKKYEFDAHGVEMNQRYKSSAVVTDGQMEPAFELDAELHYQPTTWPGARLPHAWVFDRRWRKHSTLDLGREGQFTVLTGISGEAWAAAAAKVSKARWASISCAHVIGPRRDIIDHHGDWARAREVERGGLRAGAAGPARRLARRGMADNPEAELTRVLAAILHRDAAAARQAAQ